MKNRRNYYRILQVQPDAPAEIIRASYRTLMRELKQHPDLGGSTYGSSVLNEAYEVLSNPDRRAAYDKQLFEDYTKRSFSADKRPLNTVFCPFCRRPLTRAPQPGERCQTCRVPLQSKQQADAEKPRQRTINRTKRSDRIFYYSSWPGRGQGARMIDFSPKGLRFLCSERLSLGTVLKIRGHFFEASATVRNIREEAMDGQRVYAIGVSFLAVSYEEPRGTFLSTSA